MAAKQATSAIQPGRLAAYDRLIGTVPGIARKGASIPYTSVNGNMSSYLFGEGSLALRQGCRLSQIAGSRALRRIAQFAGSRS